MKGACRPKDLHLRIDDIGHPAYPPLTPIQGGAPRRASPFEDPVATARDRSQAGRVTCQKEEAHMSVLRPLLSRRGRLVFVATALLLIAALVAAPGVSGAKPASVKQFTASISGGTDGSFTETVTNCGGPPPLVPPCTASSTIALGSVRIVVPTGFRPITSLSVTSSPPGRNWTASYNATTGNLDAHAVGGNDKLQPGESALITFTPTATTCVTGTNEFTTAAWGSIAISGADPFELVGPQPTVCVARGGTVVGPGGQTETITGNFGGHVLVTFGGDLDCSFVPTFGGQWSQFNLPTQVNIAPADDFEVGDPPSPKISTSRFPTEGADSSLYLICYAVPQADHPTPFKTRGGGDAVPRTVNGVDSWVGILPNCYNPTTEPPSINPPPCVSEQFLDVTTNPDQIVISVRMPPGDPFKK
jgi:hypothetical protein